MCPQKFGFENIWRWKWAKKTMLRWEFLVKNSIAMCKQNTNFFKEKKSACCLDSHKPKMRFHFVYWNYIKRIEVYLSPMQWSQFEQLAFFVWFHLLAHETHKFMISCFSWSFLVKIVLLVFFKKKKLFLCVGPCSLNNVQWYWIVAMGN